MFHHHRNNNITGGSTTSSTMSRSRYEAVPQADEIIELSDPSYNYNTAIPNSPPPSFHSSQSTPAVSVSGDLEHERAFNNSTPRPSVVATGNSVGSDGPLIMNLHRRVERLEETIGRLLLEKSESETQDLSSLTEHLKAQRSNCCVKFPDPSALNNAERGLLLNASSNCCVSFRGRKHRDTPEEQQRRQEARTTKIQTVMATLGMAGVMLWITVMVWLTHRPQNCNTCEYSGAAKIGAWTSAGQGEDATWAATGGS